MVEIYVLECQQGKYYVGKTKNIHRRVASHFRGKTTAWTSKYPPVKIIEVISNCDAFDEDKYTKIYMNRYGIDNVRGGTYVQLELDASTKEYLKRELITAQDRCYRCGGEGHFAKTCPVFKSYMMMFLVFIAMKQHMLSF